MFYSILGSLQSVAVVGPLCSGKTTMLADLAEKALLEGENICVIEPQGISTIRKMMKIPQEHKIVTNYTPTVFPFPDKPTQLMFMQIPHDLKDGEVVYDLQMLIKLLKIYDVFLIDEAVYTLDQFIKEDSVKGFVDLLVNDEKLVVIAVQDFKQLKGYADFQAIYKLENSLGGGSVTATKNIRRGL